MTDHDLGERLARSAGAIEPTEIDLVDGVMAAIAAEPRGHRRRPSFAVAAAIVLLVCGLIMVVAPARSAVAGWLGIGNTSVDVVDDLPDVTPTTFPTAATTAPAPDAPVPIPDERLTGPLITRETRDLGGVTETVLRYADVTLSATTVASDISFRKAVTVAEAVTSTIVTDGEPALWIEGAHTRTIREITEFVEESTLIWIRDGFEIRLTGDLSLDEAIAIGESLD